MPQLPIPILNLLVQPDPARIPSTPAVAKLCFKHIPALHEPYVSRRSLEVASTRPAKVSVDVRQAVVQVQT